MTNQSASMKTTRLLAFTALFAALSTVLMFFSFPLPLMPPFLKLDLSGVPILLCAFMFGPVPALLAAAVKDLINAFFSTSAGVGEMTDFIVTVCLVVPAGLVYRRRHTGGGAVLACSLGTLAMTAGGMLSNYFITIPFYVKAMGMPLDAILEICGKVNPLIGSMGTYIIFGAGTFTLVKGIVLSVVTALLYKRLHLLIQRVGGGK